MKVPDAEFLAPVVTKISVLENALQNQNDVIARMRIDIEEILTLCEEQIGIVNQLKEKIFAHQK